MSLSNFWKEKFCNRASLVDFALVKLSSMAFGVMLVAFIPELIKINIGWIITAVILLSIKPLYTVFRK